MNYLHELIDISKETIEPQKHKWNFKYCNKFHTKTNMMQANPKATHTHTHKDIEKPLAHTRTALVVVNIVI